MNPLVSVFDDIAVAFNADCQVISEALSNSLTESFALTHVVSQDFWKIYWNVFSPYRQMEDLNNENGDDLFNAVCGDLGLGENQRNSFFLNYDLEVNKYFSPPASNPSNNVSYSDSDLSSLHQDSSRNGAENIFKKGFLNSVFTAAQTPRHHGLDYAPPRSDSESEIFPMYADVHMGTSYRQQKKLYEQEVDHLRQQQSASILRDNPSYVVVDKHCCEGNHLNLTQAELDVKLIHAMEEMDELKVELDACCKRLDAKYQAVAILKKQAEHANTTLQSSQDKYHERSKDLEKEVSKLQFELEWRESSFMDSQQTWAERFDQVCKENTVLMTKLEARSDDLKKMTAHKCALDRERDELLALLDVTERMKYEQGKSLSPEDEYGSFSSSELAILGACKCRGSDPEPCGCAHAAANLRKEVVKLRVENAHVLQRRQEANLTVDAYRTAFEEQLGKAKTLTQKLTEVSTLTSRSVKAKAAMKYLVQVLADDEIDDEHFLKKGKEAKIKPLQQVTPMNLHQLLQILTDMIIDKKEMLAHQKLASHVLADKLKLHENLLKQCNTPKRLSYPNEVSPVKFPEREIKSPQREFKCPEREIKSPQREFKCPEREVKFPQREDKTERDQGEMTPIQTSLIEEEMNTSQVTIEPTDDDENEEDNDGDDENDGYDDDDFHTGVLDESTEALSDISRLTEEEFEEESCDTGHYCGGGLDVLPSIIEHGEEDCNENDGIVGVPGAAASGRCVNQTFLTLEIKSAPGETSKTSIRAIQGGGQLVTNTDTNDDQVLTNTDTNDDQLLTNTDTNDDGSGYDSSVRDTTNTDSTNTNPFEEYILQPDDDDEEEEEEEEEELGDSLANADNGSSIINTDTETAEPVPMSSTPIPTPVKRKSLNPFESDEEEEEQQQQGQIHTDGDQGHDDLNHHVVSDVPASLSKS